MTIPRPVLVLHRWLGIAVGLIMTIWCLSGFVMIYSPFPRLSAEAQIRGLEPLGSLEEVDWARIALPGDLRLSSARVERMGQRQVLRLTPAGGRPASQEFLDMRPQVIDLATGRKLGPVSARGALEIADRFAQRSGLDQDPVGMERVAIDQWTVQYARRSQPLRRVDFSGGDTVYVAGSGEVLLHTTQAQRCWGWLGAVPHWLYPTLLRQNGALWAQVVIWASIAGCFLTLTGLWVGIARMRRGAKARLGSQYRGIWWWHHVSGLVFGLLVLTWVASGLLTMGPWGLLGGSGAHAARDALQQTLRWEDLRATLAAAPHLPAATNRLEPASLGERLYLTVMDEQAGRFLLGRDGKKASLSREELREALKPAGTLARLELIHSEDAYYYAHGDTLELPVWRATLGDAEGTRLYLSARTGHLLRAVDGDGRTRRWLMDALHRFDFPGLRPWREIVMLPLLAMVTLVCATGTWMGFRKAKRDVAKTIKRRRQRRRRLSGAIKQH